MSRFEPRKPRYFRIEAILEAPTWALVAAVLLMTAIVAVQVISQIN